jgi:CheY-like chemotaxis protein
MSVFQHVLESRGFPVLRAGSSPEALEQFRRQPDKIDLLIADLALPGGSGVDVALECLDRSARLRALLTSGSPPSVWNKRDRDNFDLLPRRRIGFLQKPFSPGALLASVVDLLDTRAELGASA